MPSLANSFTAGGSAGGAVPGRRCDGSQVSSKRPPPTRRFQLCLAESGPISSYNDANAVGAGATCGAGVCMGQFSGPEFKLAGLPAADGVDVAAILALLAGNRPRSVAAGRRIFPDRGYILWRGDV